MRGILAAILALIALWAPARAQEIRVTELPQQRLSVAPGEYSGITYLSGNRYAVVDDDLSGGGIVFFDIPVRADGRVRTARVRRTVPAGTASALYKEAAVVLLERRRFDEKMLEEARREGSRKTIGLLPLGYQRPKSFDASPALNPDRQGTLYWNPCIRTDLQGHADVALPNLPDTYYLRLEGQTLDGRRFQYVNP